VWFINYLFKTFYNNVSGHSMTNWINDMDESRNVRHTKLTNPPCEIETWANNGAIDGEYGLYTTDIPIDLFFSNSG